MDEGRTTDDTDARERWVHEDHLINNRLTWLGVTQGLLLAAYGFSLRELTDLSTRTPRPETYDLLQFLIRSLPWIGLVTSLLVMLGVGAAGLAMKRIKDQYRLKTYGISTLTTVMGWSSGFGIAVVFTVAWLLLMLKGHALFAA